MRFFGYSTGAVALGDFGRALNLLSRYEFEAVELSALRISEVEPLLEALPNVDLERYKYVSFHAPSAFKESEEQYLVQLLSRLPANWPIVLHPDAIHHIERWLPISDRLAIENMDRRKDTGRSVSELQDFFQTMPNARMCLDLGHARQVDPSMVGAYQLMKKFGDRIVQLHISEVDTLNRHDTISKAAEIAFLQVRAFVPDSAAIILEARVREDEIGTEAAKVAAILSGREWNQPAVALA